VQNTFKGMEDALVNFVKTGKMDFTDFANSVIADMARIMIQQSITGPLAGAAGNLLQGLFSSGSVGIDNPDTGAFIAANPTPNAKGNVFSGISGFSNRVVAAPTFFSHAGVQRFGAGSGLMGEAGPEAVMPLRRGPGGRLGVDARGGGGSVTNVTVINNASGAQATQKTTTNATGGKDITVMVDEIMGQVVASGRGKFHRSFQQFYGSKPSLSNR
jgi:lambda family phage tail tape measure protein